jgi:hypothetical protein
MNSAQVTFVASMRGKVKGTAANAGLQSSLGLSSNFLASLSSTLTGASQFNQGFGFSTTPRTLAGGASEELDTQSFTNLLQETAQAIAEIRLFVILHSAASLATTGIRVGNATANQFRIFGAATTTTLDFLPGEGIIGFAPTATAMPASATLRYLKVLNLHGSLTASYYVGWLGSTS